MCTINQPRLPCVPCTMGRPHLPSVTTPSLICNINQPTKPHHFKLPIIIFDQRERGRKRARERAKDSQKEWEGTRERARERQSETDRITESQRGPDKESQRGSQRELEREKEIARESQREGERERCGILGDSCAAIPLAFSCATSATLLLPNKTCGLVFGNFEIWSLWWAACH